MTKWLPCVSCEGTKYMVSFIHLCQQRSWRKRSVVLDCIIIRAYIFRWKMVCNIHIAHSFGSWSKLKLWKLFWILLIAQGHKVYPVNCSSPPPTCNSCNCTVSEHCVFLHTTFFLILFKILERLVVIPSWRWNAFSKAFLSFNSNYIWCFKEVEYNRVL